MTAENPTSVEQELSRLTEKNRELTEAMESQANHYRLLGEQIHSRLELTRNTIYSTGRKRYYLSRITRHGILDQLLILRSFVEQVKSKTTDPELQRFIRPGERAVRYIDERIAFMKDYEFIGVYPPEWQNIGTGARSLQGDFTDLKIDVSPVLEGIEVFAERDRLQETLWNLVADSRRRGSHTCHISVTTEPEDRDQLIILFDDDGESIPGTEKEQIFRQETGKRTDGHLGLFLSRVILDLTGIRLRETGEPGKGARFEMFIPKGVFRFTDPTGSALKGIRETGQLACHIAGGSPEPGNLLEKNMALMQETSRQKERIAQLQTDLTSALQHSESLQEQITKIEKDQPALEKERADREEEIVRLKSSLDMLAATNEIIRRRTGEKRNEPGSLPAPDKESTGGTTETEPRNEESRLREEFRLSKDAHRKMNERLHTNLRMTRHEILNLNTALKGYIELSKSTMDPNRIAAFLEKMEKFSDSISQWLNFSREYENCGINLPVWQNLHEIVGKAVAFYPPCGKVITNCPRDLEILADPVLERVVSNLLENSVRHGERVTEIHISSYNEGTDLVVVWEDDGVGIPPDQKEKIFLDKPRRAGFSLVLSRIVLDAAGIAIRETGVYGKGARFEMTVPEGAYRFTARHDADSG